MRDITAPSGPTVSIAAGATFTNTTSVTLNLSAAGSPTEVYLTNTAGCGNGGTWQAYATSKSWTLGQSNSTATVYAKFRDAALNETTCENDTIIHDNVAPEKPTLALSSPASSPATVSTPTLLASSTEAGATVFLYSDSGCSVQVASGAASGSTLLLTTSALNSGSNILYIKQIDAAENSSTGCETAALTYVLDNSGPTAVSVNINSGAAVTSITAVTLDLAATETLSNPVQMCVMEGTSCGSCTTWETFSSTKSFTLSAGYGTKNVSAIFADNLGNISTCVSDSIVLETDPLLPRYANAPKWNDYVRTSDMTTACNGSETGERPCLHGGDKKKLEVTGYTACTNLVAVDALDAFEWSCDNTSGTATFYSKLKSHKNLSDLIDTSTPTAPNWRQNHVTVTQLSTQILQTSPSIWWTNVVYSPLPADTADAWNLISGRIAVISQNGTYGQAGIADKSALIVMPGINYSSLNNGSSAIVFGGKFYWIEGWYTGNLGQAAIDIQYGNFGVLRNVTVAEIAGGWGVGFFDSSYHQINGLRGSAHLDSYVLVLDGDSHRNEMTNLTFANSWQGVFIGQNSGYNVIQNVHFSAGQEALTNSGTRTIVTGLFAGNMGTGSYTYTDSGIAGIIHNFASINSGYGITFQAQSKGNTVSQAALLNSQLGIYSVDAQNTRFTGNLLLGNNGSDCFVLSGTNPGLASGASCSPQGASDHSVVTGLSAATSFVGKVTTDDPHTPSDINGARIWGDIADLSDGLLRWLKGWGRDDGAAFPAAAHRGRCGDPSTCRIWDWRLKDSDTVLRNSSNSSGGVLTQNSGAFSVGAACPAAASGNEVLTSLAVCSDGSLINQATCEAAGKTWFFAKTYHKNAMEIVGESPGNNDGLCESGETCLYTPNFGVYQGQGNKGMCTFANGILSNINLYGYETNGMP